MDVNVCFGDDRAAAVQAKVYGFIREDIWDGKKGRAAEPFKRSTFPVVKVLPSSDTVTYNSLS